MVCYTPFEEEKKQGQGRVSRRTNLHSSHYGMFLLRDELYLQANSRVKKKARNGEHFGEFDKVDVLNRLLSREIEKFAITLIHHVNFSEPP